MYCNGIYAKFGKFHPSAHQVVVDRLEAAHALLRTDQFALVSKLVHAGRSFSLHEIVVMSAVCTCVPVSAALAVKSLFLK